MTTSAPAIPSALFRTAHKHGDTLALVFKSRRDTYAELTDRVLRAASVLAKTGLKKGDRFAIWMPNSPAWVEASLGAMCLGAIVVPINTRLKPGEASYILKKSAASVAIAGADFLGTNFVASLKSLDLPDLKTILSVRFDDPASEWDGLLAAVTPDEIATARRTAESIQPDDLAEVIFTSGTTGFPKGAMITHGQITRAYQFYADRAEIRAADRSLIIAPMFHSFGFKAGVIVALLKGATMYPVPVFDVEETLKAVEEEKITVMGGPPTILISLLDANKKLGRDINSLNSIVLGGSMIPPELIRTLRGEIGVEIVLSAYGMTETTALVTMSRKEDGVERISTSAGQVVDHMEMRCVDAEDREVPTGTPGEIQARGLNIMQGYFDDPERTRESFTEDGWFRTGDVGIIDAEGYLTITDRMKDMFIVGGFNCYPAEIEAIIRSHPAVDSVAVIGVPDERMGEVAKAYVVLRAGASLQESEFLAWCRENMANFKVPRSVEFIDALPCNAMGKVQKFLLRERAKGNAAADN